MALVPVAGQAQLLLEALTAAKYALLRQRVFNRTGKWIFITFPYGANRSWEEQAYLRRGYDLGLPGFYYAAKPGTPQANHMDGEAFDINNWASVGEQVIKEEAAKLGLVRDFSERWHWNNLTGGRYLPSGTIIPAGGEYVPIFVGPNEAVRDLQKALNHPAFEYGLQEDGFPGALTAAAVLDFQTKNDLAVDGAAGSQTWTAIRGRIAEYEMTLAEIKSELERVITALGSLESTITQRIALAERRGRREERARLFLNEETGKYVGVNWDIEPGKIGRVLYFNDADHVRRHAEQYLTVADSPEEAKPMNVSDWASLGRLVNGTDSLYTPHAEKITAPPAETE